MQGMFKVGDVVQVNTKNTMYILMDDSEPYEILEIREKKWMHTNFGTFCVLAKLSNKNEMWDIEIQHITLDVDYYRRNKIKKLCSRLGKK